MAAMGYQEASPIRCSYHVFLSFRGEDTRKTFTDHLYTALLHAGIRTFRDDDELGRGDDIYPELMKGIKESRISIIVFSKDYASSTWCLDELLRILERKKSVGHMILPVFYHVEPSVVRWQTESFAESFAEHEKRLKSKSDEIKEEGMDKIRRWKEALKEVANLSGSVLKDEYESKFIQKIVKEIGNKLNRTVLSVCSYPVGLDSRINDINLWLQDGSIEVGIVAICGMRGIGKTTIAKTVYNLNFDRFEGSSFLANVRETSEEFNGLVRLQRQLLSDILKGKKVKISSVDEGIIKIRDAIGCKRILLVLDDVDQLDQLNAILMMRGWFQQGSKIIITTSNEQLLKAHELHKMHKVKELTYDESFQLFSRHAFGQDHPIEGYMEHTKGVVQYCGGHPLALQILGSSLSGRSIDVWESAIKKLEEIPDSQILKKLKISFDSLQDDHDKNLFLDISCFFVRKDIDLIITILDECGFCTKVGIQNLVDRCLLTIEENNKLTMHQLIREMGREIIRQESPKEPGKRSRVWHRKDALYVLREKTGTETIEGLILNLHVSEQDRPAQNFFGLDNSKRHPSEDFLDKSTLPCGSNSSKRRRLGFFSWLPTNSVSTESFSTSNEVDLRTDAFSRMHKLRLLQLNNAMLTGDYKEFPRKLRWLCWRGFPLKSIPSEFILDSLVALDLRNSSLKQVWKGIKVLKSLKILNLSHSHGLTHTPNFSKLPNLERLILKYCINLIEVHESIGELERLVLLNLKGCENLRNLPTKIGQLKSLESLILSGCSKLDNLPKELCEMESLKVLHADGVTINQLPSTSSDIISWHSRWFSWVSRPRKAPESISSSLVCLPRSLISLSLANCNLLDDTIPRDLSSLSLLRDLNLEANPMCSLPESIKNLTMLETLGLDNCTRLQLLPDIKGLTMLQSLYLENCSRLQLLPELPMSLESLNLDNCRSLEIITNLPNLLKSLSLSVVDCDKLVEVQKLFRLVPIRKIDAEMIKILGLVELESMGRVEVKLFNRPTSTNRIGPIQGLYECGIFSIFLPGNEVPDWFGYKSTIPWIYFIVPSFPNLKVRGLNVCVVYAYDYTSSSDNHWNEEWEPFIMTIFNRTKDLKWAYFPVVYGIPDGGENMIWSSHWKIGNQLEVGDEVLVSVVGTQDFKGKNAGSARFQAKEFGVHIVYEEDEKDTQHNTYSSCPDDDDVIDDGLDLSLYQARRGAYFLCHFDRAIFSKPTVKEFLFGDFVWNRL